MAEKKEKKYVSDNAQLMAEWDWEKNDKLTPTNLTHKSNKKVWWKCHNGHQWQASIANRSKGSNCPYCSGRYVIHGENDLQVINPVLAKEWHYKKNNRLTPIDVLPNSGIKVWWMCANGHEWKARVADRNKGRGCPYCAGKKVLKYYNDLLTTNPILAQEWNYEKNRNLIPENFTANSNQKVWWKCSKEHEWQATIAHRNNGQGCPVCDSERHTSFPEYALFYYLKKYDIEVLHSYKEKGYELDIYLPSLKIAIEYDGYFWHKNKESQDLEKNKKCVKDEIILYRIREGLPSLNDSSIDYLVHRYQENLSIILKEVLDKIIETNVDVDIQRDAIDIENLREYTEKRNSLLFLKPEIAQEWNYDKNRNLLPEKFTSNSGKKVWWKCVKGHEWQATIASRNKGSGCPYCAGLLVIKGENDLQTLNPILAKEWHYTQNKDLTPADVMSNSGKKVWWKCVKGHEWQATIANRNKGSGCPYCSGNKVLTGYNDLQTINPHLAEEWNYEKNNRLSPLNVMPNSGKKVWWKCKEGHEWQAKIENRNKGKGCPECAKTNRKKSQI